MSHCYMKLIICLGMVCSSLVFTTCGYSQENNEANELVVVLRKHASVSNKFRIDFMRQYFDGNLNTDSTYVDSNIVFSMLYDCLPQCENTAKILISKLGQLHNTKCGTSKLSGKLSGKFYFLHEEGENESIYFYHSGKKFFYKNKCYEAENSIWEDLKTPFTFF